MQIPKDKFMAWLASKRLSEKTLKQYMYKLDRFYYDRFSQETISNFLAIPKNDDLITRAFLKNFKKFLLVNHRELGLTDSDLLMISEVELPQRTGRSRKNIIKVLTHDQIKDLENALTKEKEKIQLLLSYYCGLRLGELMKIRVIDFNWNTWREDVESPGECNVQGKGNKEGIAIVPSFLMKRIANFIRSKPPGSVDSRIFVSDKGSMNYEMKLWQEVLFKAGVESGITKKDSEGNIIPQTRVHPHLLRHSFATYLMKKGVSIKEIQELLRHSSISSTQRYVHVDKSELKQRLSNIFT